jgi:hypothetical protein
LDFLFSGILFLYQRLLKQTDGNDDQRQNRAPQQGPEYIFLIGAPAVVKNRRRYDDSRNCADVIVNGALSPSARLVSIIMTTSGILGGHPRRRHALFRRDGRALSSEAF